MVPGEVPPGEATAFSYFLRPEGRNTSFDRLALESSTELRFMGVAVDEEDLDAAVARNRKRFPGDPAAANRQQPVGGIAL